MDCLLPLLFLGQPEALPPWAFEPPIQLQSPQKRETMTGKTLYGNPFPNQIYSDNFTVGWENGQSDSAAANAAINALEITWNALISEMDWQAPVSSESHFVWVILTNDLSGTGFTTVYTDENFPQGYPVIYLNPAYSNNADFWASLAAHEMAHAIQYSYRSYATNAEEPWYWEASAEWQAELSLPNNNSYGYQSTHYAENPQLRYSSMKDNHQYGMFVLNAYIEEYISGPGTLREIWEHAQSAPNSNWGEVIPEALDQKIGKLIAGMAQKMASLAFQDGAHYVSPIREGKLTDGAGGDLAYLGSHYWDSDRALRVTASGDVLLSSESNMGSEVILESGETLAVTGLNPSSASYTLTLFDLSDSGPDDSGNDTGGPNESPTGGCACKSTSSQKAHTGIFAAMCLLFLRRRIPNASSR